ncbi:DUF4429 domain-containing protein [Saccharopolyspora rhizosphaerae]|uniref:DUF4429 domain-containing protein n=1 Tax=Saccharopolyspora rhizosphaerae TaxID=2492662 RepID=A0A3R8NWB7_9PSEU|nr:DUF4429 domain-containing protein [Saccharopolyspora rhizosphaerae]RRO14718.1 DUF4429 domain-containing protein [Saccharopolyspora rhizosphaerae]
MGLGLELAGTNATWVFEQDRIEINYSSGLGQPRLLRKIKHRTIPYQAVSRATASGGDGNPQVMLHLRPGADPLTDVAAGQLSDESEPHLIELEPEQQELATYYADHINDHCDLNPDSDSPAPRFLVEVDQSPRRLKGYDGEASFDGSAVEFQWHPDASRVKHRSPKRRHELTELAGVEWVKPGLTSGHLLLVPHGERSDAPPVDNVRTLLFGFGFGTTAVSLPFAAAVQAAIQQAQPEAPLGLRSAASRPALPSTTPRPEMSREEILATIRELGKLHADGILTQGEFEQKKRELLDRL